MYIKKSSGQCQNKEGANPRQLLQAFGPHQQGAAQSLPGTVGLKYVHIRTCTCSPWEHRAVVASEIHIPKSSSDTPKTIKKEWNTSSNSAISTNIYMYMYMYILVNSAISTSIYMYMYILVLIALLLLVLCDVI